MRPPGAGRRIGRRDVCRSPRAPSRGLRRAALLLALIALPPASGAVAPHRSWTQLPTGNGYGFSLYDAARGEVTLFTERPYAAASPGAQTRNLAASAVFGVRASGEAAWLRDVPVDAAGYVEESHVARAAQALGPLRAETYAWTPWGAGAPALVLALRATNTSARVVSDGAVYALLDFHLGTGAPQPGSDGEQIDWDAATRSFVEQGPSGLSVRYTPSGLAVHAASPQDVRAIGRAGGELVSLDSSGVRSDAVAGFQWALGSLAPGEERWVSVTITLGGAPPAAGATSAEVQQALQAELDAWRAWRAPPPAGLSDAELRVWRQGESVLRMAQVRESGPANGQLLASLPPGQWWISWVRDQAYAVAALSRMGHLDEARAALAFWSAARVGTFKQYVGADYAVSVARYYGDGEEWSDSNPDGPNVELDGFGLAAWAGRLAGATDLDVAAGPLPRLIDSTGLVMADSSIWERHWNGQQKHFAYTSIAAAAGLCAVGQAARATALRDAISQRLGAPDGAIASSLEELRDRAGWLDASTVEAINLGLFDPAGRAAKATLAQLSRLRPATGRGYFRNDDGAGYDSQEWVFIDLRAAAALNRAGQAAAAGELLSWVTQQADANAGLHAELYDAAAADYAGAVPMVGFGAGAYALALLDRQDPGPRPSCFLDAPRPASSGCASAGAGGAAQGLLLLALLWRRRRP